MLVCYERDAKLFGNVSILSPESKVTLLPLAKLIRKMDKKFKTKLANAKQFTEKYDFSHSPKVSAKKATKKFNDPSSHLNLPPNFFQQRKTKIFSETFSTNVSMIPSTFGFRGR